jgi:photosystem II stability/assembly factor-like uncharacterized protein
MKKLLLIMIVLTFCFVKLSAEWVRISDNLKKDGPSEMVSLAVENNMIFAGSLYGGIYRTSNDGITWDKVYKGNDYTVISIDIIHENIYAAYVSGGIAISKDNGSTWNYRNNGLTSDSMTVVVADEGIILAGTKSKGIFLSTNNGDSWIIKNNGLNDLRIQTITISDKYIFASTWDGIYLSTDKGENWVLKCPGIVARQIVVDRNRIFAGSYGQGIYLSTDNGENWIEKNNGFKNLNFMCLAINGDNLIIGTGYTLDFEHDNFYISKNNSDSWYSTNFPNGPVSGDIIISYLVIKGNDIYSRTSEGIFKGPSLDIGIVGIDDDFTKSHNSNLKLALNHVSNYLTISFNEESKHGSTNIQIFNSIGEIALSVALQNPESQQIDISVLPPGLYFVRYGSEYGKFIKE